MAHRPTVYITCSDQHRNGKTLLARMLLEYLMLDGLDPVGIDTDAPIAPLRNFFPGRTRLADFKQTQGRMKVFDTILGAPGRDYVIDLPQRFTQPFLDAVLDLKFFDATHELGFRIFFFFVVDNSPISVRAARETSEVLGIDLFVPVHNKFVGSAWPEGEGALVIPDLPQALFAYMLEKRFSIREFVMGDDQGVPPEHVVSLKRFFYDVLQSLNDLEPDLSLRELKRF